MYRHKITDLTANIQNNGQKNIRNKIHIVIIHVYSVWNVECIWSGAIDMHQIQIQTHFYAVPKAWEQSVYLHWNSQMMSTQYCLLVSVIWIHTHFTTRAFCLLLTRSGLFCNIRNYSISLSISLHLTSNTLSHTMLCYTLNGDFFKILDFHCCYLSMRTEYDDICE